MPNSSRIQRPKWSPEFSWNGVVSVFSLLSVLFGGLGLLWLASTTWAVAQTDIQTLKSAQNQLRIDMTYQQQQTDSKIQRVQESTERLLDVIHTDVQAIKNILI